MKRHTMKHILALLTALLLAPWTTLLAAEPPVAMPLSSSTPSAGPGQESPIAEVQFELG